MAAAVLLTCLASACYESTDTSAAMRITKLVPDEGPGDESWSCTIRGSGFAVLVYRNLSCGYPYGTEGDDRFEVTLVSRETPDAAPVSIGPATWRSEQELLATVPSGLAAGVYDVQIKSPLGVIATKDAALSILETEPPDSDSSDTDSSGTDSHGTDSHGTDSESAGDSDELSEFLDQGFGEKGRFSSPSDLKAHTPNDAVTAPDGSIFIAGSVSNGANADLALLKLTPDGDLDTSFNAKGYLTRDNIDGGDRDDVGTSIVLAPDGDLLVCGHSGPIAGDQRGFLWKVSQEGVDDASFGAAGTYLFDPGYRISRAEYDSGSGHIFVVGTFGGNVHVFRVLKDGSGLDPGFNGGAPVALWPSSTKDAAIEPLHDGTLLVAGQCIVDTHYLRACSWRVDAKGTVKKSYANYGDQALVHFGATKDGDYGLWNDVITSPGDDTRVILAGSRDSIAKNPDETLAKVHLSDGSFDTSFGEGDGIWTEDLLGLEEVGKITSELALEDGTVLAASKVVSATNQEDVAVIRLDAAGVRDKSFTSENGILVLGVDYQHITPKLIPHSPHRVLVLSSEHEAVADDVVLWAIAI